MGDVWIEAGSRRGLCSGLIATAVSVGAFYGVTMCRWIGLGDTALAVASMARLNLNSHVNNHPATMLLGHLFLLVPLGEPALRANLMSVALGTGAALLAFAIFYRTLGRWWPSFVAVFAVAVMHSLWWHSTLVESYALNAVALLAVVWLLVEHEAHGYLRHLYAACALSGLAILNHVQMGCLAPGLLAYALVGERSTTRARLVRLASMAGWYLVGLVPYLALLLRDLARAESPRQVLYWAAGGDFSRLMFDYTPQKVLVPLAKEFLLQFPSPMLGFAALGVAYVWRRRYRVRTHVALAAVFVTNTAFFAGFHTWDRFAFLLPSFLIVAYLAVVGMRCAFEWVTPRSGCWQGALWATCALCVVLPPIVYQHVPAWGAGPGIWHQRFNNEHTHNTHNLASYMANPNKRHWSDADTFARRLFAKLPARALLFDDDGRTYHPLALYYQGLLGVRSDVTIRLIDSWGFAGVGVDPRDAAAIAAMSIDRRDVFLVSVRPPYDAVVDALARRDIVPVRFDLDEHRWVYRLARRAHAGPDDTRPIP